MIFTRADGIVTIAVCIIIVTIILVGVAYHYLKPKILYYYMDGCPFCADFDTNVWNDFMKSAAHIFYDCQKIDGAGKDPKDIDGVTGFPTIMLKYHFGTTVEFKGERTQAGFEQWLSNNPPSSVGKPLSNV